MTDHDLDDLKDHSAGPSAFKSVTTCRYVPRYYSSGTGAGVTPNESAICWRLNAILAFKARRGMAVPAHAQTIHRLFTPIHHDVYEDRPGRHRARGAASLDTRRDRLSSAREMSREWIRRALRGEYFSVEPLNFWPTPLACVVLRAYAASGRSRDFHDEHAHRSGCGRDPATEAAAVPTTADARCAGCLLGAGELPPEAPPATCTIRLRGTASRANCNWFRMPDL